MQEPSTSYDPTTDLDPINDLPLQMIKSETIPPAPNRSEYAIDWLPDFAGYSWIAYGASSLLVISHFPSPLSHLQSQIGPVLRQVFELSDCRDEASSAVDAVAWSPVTPSCGDLASASDNCVFVFEYDSKLNGSFCWSQTAVLVQSIKVLAIRWTGSGDGIVVGGTEVVLWRNKFKSWEIAWKFIPEHPQTLVSANWSIEEPVATSAYQSVHHFAGSPAILHEASKSVLVCHDDGKSDHFISNLHHPLPVFMIQWRPVMGRQQKRYPVRSTLLTCCLDGTVRFWSEIDDGRIRKLRKDTNNQKTMRRAYCVVGVIEINQSLNATLGTDIFVAWATQIGGGIDMGDIHTYVYSMNGYECDKAGRCEWLVGVGPGKLLIFWAIHCLDDVSPPRFPRITQWEKRELKDPEVKGVQRTNYSTSVTRPILDKVVILRNCSFGPPALCSLVQLLPCNSLCWSVLYTQTSICKDGGLSNNSRRTDLLSCYAGRVLNIDGHNGKILQVAVHTSSEVELAASLDSNGLVLFWSLATFSNCIMHASMLNSIWRPCGRLVSEISNDKYLCLSWAPSILYDDRVLLLGHTGGIDCFVVNFSQCEEGKLACHLLCTIPFIGHGSPRDGPTNIFSFPLSSTCDKPFSCNNFLLLGVWMKDFKAISWKIAVHSYDLPRSCCECSFDATSTLCGTWRFESTFSDKRYCVFVDPCSLELPDLQASNQVTSLAVASPGKFVPSVPELLVGNHSIFHMATGCTDGSLKLWRSNLANISASHVPWELVGMFAAHHGPISAISFTDCGRKFATTCKDNGSTDLHLWDSLSLMAFGTSIIEAKISLGGDIVALNWFDMGTEFILGVCMRNELRVYASRRCGSHSLANPAASVEDAWFCIATVQSLPPVCDFLWGSRSTAIIIHGSYFSLFGQWLSRNDITTRTEWHLKCVGDNPHCFNESEKENMSSIFSDISIFGLKEILTEDSGRPYKSRLPVTATCQNNHQYGNLIAARTSGDKFRIWSMPDIVEKLCGSLPVYYPEALLENILSGNWKRAFVAVRHLVGHLTSYDASERKGGLSISGHIVPQVNLSDHLEGLLSKSTDGKGFQWNREPSSAILTSQVQKGMTKSAYGLDLNVSNDTLTSLSTKNELGGFVESVERLHHLAALSSEEKLHTLAIIDLLHEISFPNSASAYESLDGPGRRFSHGCMPVALEDGNFRVLNPWPIPITHLNREP
ncbi:hypothetical protein RJ641_015860 [Dillenia turbinata]|uniref:RAVE complex protein Rav1 C-terminal domain-containing protein n=1 Tax=Dillenia turbinata TaxID=194707 RepID=A0AAN8UXR3_9MAGN